MNGRYERESTTLVVLVVVKGRQSKPQKREGRLRNVSFAWEEKEMKESQARKSARIRSASFVVSSSSSLSRLVTRFWCQEKKRGEKK